MRVDQQQAPSGSKKLGHYDKFYAQGGWAYSVREERRKLKKWVVPTAGWKRGQHVLEIGCGMGLQASILRDLGLTVTAVDASAVGIEQAIARYGGKKGLEYVCADLAEWAPAGSVDGIYCRGMSWFHYELLGVNKKGVDVPAQLDRMFGWLGTGGVFVLEITTDFSGRKGGPGRVVHDNRLEDYLRLFEPLGEINPSGTGRGATSRAVFWGIERGAELVRGEQGGQTADGQDNAAAYHQDSCIHRRASSAIGTQARSSSNRP